MCLSIFQLSSRLSRGRHVASLVHSTKVQAQQVTYWAWQKNSHTVLFAMVVMTLHYQIYWSVKIPLLARLWNVYFSWKRKLFVHTYYLPVEHFLISPIFVFKNPVIWWRPLHLASFGWHPPSPPMLPLLALFSRQRLIKWLIKWYIIAIVTQLCCEF